jgi:hypothetical protein
VCRAFVGRRLARLRRSELDVEDNAQESLIAIHARFPAYDGEALVPACIYDNADESGTFVRKQKFGAARQPI